MTFFNSFDSQSIATQKKGLTLINNEKIVLLMKNIEMEFPGVKALNKVDFELKEGEVHALVGANGAGKSTLAKILSGIYPNYKGTIFVNGIEHALKNPMESIRAGIISIAQEFNLVNDFSIYENIYLGEEPLISKYLGLLDRNKMYSYCEILLKKYGLNIDPKTKVAKLGVAQKQIVEVIKAIERDAKILIMDEPTAVLSKRETSLLFETIRELKKKGISIIFISHRLEEVFEVSDRISVLRDGKKVFVSDEKDSSNDELIDHMLGEIEKRSVPRKEDKTEKVILEIESIRINRIKNVSFKLRSGEAVGIIGKPGSGKSELLRSIFGAEKLRYGNFFFKKKEVYIRSPRKAINLGIGLLTEDRRRDGLFPLLSIAINITIPLLKALSDFSFLKNTRIFEIATYKINELKIVAKHPNQRVESLSGGNQQKVILSRWLSVDADLLLFEEPTRGIDVRGKEELLSIIEDLKANGKCCLIVSSELEELMRLCERIIVLKDGYIVRIIEEKEYTKKGLLRYVMGE